MNNPSQGGEQESGRVGSGISLSSVFVSSNGKSKTEHLGCGRGKKVTKIKFKNRRTTKNRFDRSIGKTNKQRAPQIPAAAANRWPRFCAVFESTLCSCADWPPKFVRFVDFHFVRACVRGAAN